MANKVYVAVEIHDDETVTITFENVPVDHVGDLLSRLGSEDIRTQFARYVQGASRKKFEAVWEAKLKE